MKQLSFDECNQWFNANKFLCNELRRYGPTIDTENSIKIPEDAGKRIAMVKQISDKIKGKEILLYYSDWSIWPSREWFPLFQSLNIKNKFMTDLKNYPGIYFDTNEYEELINYVILGAVFLWDFFCCQNDGNVLAFSHDEFIEEGKLIKKKENPTTAST